MGKVIVITGGSEGLGKAIAAKLTGANKIIILARSEEKVKKAAEELACDYFICDVSDFNQVQQTVEKIKQKYKKIDCLINNAGVYFLGELDNNSYEQIEMAMATNANGTIYMTKAVIPIMKQQKAGVIINIVSLAGVMSKAERSLYHASKWAVTGFTKSVQLDLAKYGIRVTGIYPGAINTQIFEKAGFKREMSDALQPAQVASVVEFILNSDSDVLYLDISLLKN